MQVKQQKKSSNKWTCVICNQKQSVRKVFARGFQAKDVRKFVQGFNTARQLAHDETLIEDERVVEEESLSRETRRSDWSEYLEPQDQEEEENGSDCEPAVVTELPKDMFKKPRLKDYSSKSDGKKLYSPTFAKRKANNEPSNSQRKSYSAGLNKPEGKKLYSPTFAKRKIDNKTIKPQEQDGKGKSQSHMMQGFSKWSDYLAQDEDYLSFGTVGDSSDAQGPWNYGMFETSFSDQRVEDEVHPDFH